MEISQPEIGKESIKPTGSEKRIPPRAASERRISCCMVAMREAQLEKQSPARKNIKPTVIRKVLFENGRGVVGELMTGNMLLASNDFVKVYFSSLVSFIE